MDFKLQRLCSLSGPAPREEIVAGLIAAGELAILAGQPGSGKTAVAVLLASAVSTGNPFLGRRVRCGEVVYIAAERSNSVRRRLKAAQCDARWIWFSDAVFDIRKSANALANTLMQVGAKPTLIIIDTLARIIPDAEENSAKDMNQAMQALNNVLKSFPDTAIVLVHHTGKNGRGLRGSSAILAAVDLELIATRAKGGGVVSVEKSNEVREGQKLHYCLSPHKSDYGDEIVLAVERENTNKVRQENAENFRRAEAADDRAMRVRDAIPKGETVSRDQLVAIMDRVGVLDQCKETSRSTVVARLIARLLELGAIEEVDGKYRRLEQA